MLKQEIIQLSSSCFQQTDGKMSLSEILIQQPQSPFSYQKPLSISTESIKRIDQSSKDIRFDGSQQKPSYDNKCQQECFLDNVWDGKRQQQDEEQAQNQSQHFQQQWVPQTGFNNSLDRNNDNREGKRKKIRKNTQKKHKKGTQEKCKNSKKHQTFGKKKDQLSNCVFNAIQQYFNIDF